MVVVAEALDLSLSLFGEAFEFLGETVFAAAGAGVFDCCDELVEVVGLGRGVEELSDC